MRRISQPSGGGHGPEWALPWPWTVTETLRTATVSPRMDVSLLSVDNLAGTPDFRCPCFRAAHSGQKPATLTKSVQTFPSVSGHLNSSGKGPVEQQSVTQCLRKPVTPRLVCSEQARPCLVWKVWQKESTQGAEEMAADSAGSDCSSVSV